MPVKMELIIANEKSAEKLLNDVINRLQNAKPVWEWVSDNVVLKALQGQFKTEGARGGTKWRAYTADEVNSGYVAYKKKKTGEASPLLDWKGPNRRLAPSFIDPNHPEHVNRVSAYGLERGSSVPYAKGHNDGTGRGWKNKYTVPKRPITVLTTRLDIAKIVEATHAYFTDGRTGLAKVKPVQ